MPNFVGYEGFRLPSRFQRAEKAGASRTINAGWTDCHQPEGNSKSKITFRVDSSAKTVRVDPACTKTPQKTVAPTNRMEITMRRLRSARVHFAMPSRYTNRPTTTLP